MFTKTNLEWDKYARYLEKAINKSKFAKRAEIKPMATPKGAGDSHLTSRATHQRLAAEIIKRISEELGLNYKYAYIGMLMHDAGHPFSAHEGEEIFNLIGRVNNCGYYHHNAKGVEVILGEDICGKAIEMIPGIEDNPELRKRLEEEFPYFLDIVISHDGEATKSDMKKEATPYASMSEAVTEKLRLSNSTNNYKFIAQTEEGKLAKIADVLAYLPTDIQDGFRLGIIDGFNDDYLAIFGEMFSNDDSLDRQGKIEYAKKMINKIKASRVRELVSDTESPENQNILSHVNEIISQAQQQGLNIASLSDTDRDLLDEIIENKIKQIKENTTVNNDEEEQMLNADMVKLKEFTSKMLSVSTDVVTTLMNKMEEYFITDFIDNSKKTGRLEFSKKVEDLYYKLKGLNYENIVQYTKWDYQREGQPEAARDLVDIVSKSLIHSGAIRDKFYDRTIRRKINNPEALEYMTTPRRPEEEYEEYKKKTRIIRGRKSLEGKYKETNPKKLHTYDLYKSVYEYTRKHGDSFARKYMNVFEAIPYTVTENVEKALENTKPKGDFLLEYQQNNNDVLRARFIGEYGSIEEAKKHKQEIIERLIEEERQNMEEKVAVQLAIDYLSGMTDRSFNDLAIKTGYMTYGQVYEAHRDMKPSSTVKDRIADLKEDKKDETEGHEL